ncbi:MAG TPA: hypothetical protein VIM19_03475 [Actinomycetes bacterium]
MSTPLKDLRLLRRAAIAVAVVGLSAATLPFSAASASASTDEAHGRGAVFVQLNFTSGNRVAAYARAADGTLTAAGTYDTGGLGGTETGAPLDALASQGGLTYDRPGHVLVAVNAGSDTVTSFSVRGARLDRTAVVSSGGEFPTSVTVHGDLAYVLNAGGDGSISGFRVKYARLVPIPGSTRSLGLGNDPVPSFIQAPAQVGFSDDGNTLIVTTKAHNTLLTFPVDSAGVPSATPTVTPSAGAVPFSFVVDPRGTVHVTEAATGNTSSYAVNTAGGLTLLGSSASDGGAALCWNVRVGRYLFGANAGSASLSSWRLQADGTAALAAPVAATTNAGPIDLAASRDGRFLYVQESVAGTLGVYAVSSHGHLHRIQTVTGLPAFSAGGMEGLAAA